MAITDRVVGLAMMLAAVFIFTYYTSWVALTVRSMVARVFCSRSCSPFIPRAPRPLAHPPRFSLSLPLSLPPQPFLPASHPLQRLFPDVKWALIGPLVVAVCGVTALTLFVLKVKMAKRR